MISFFTRFIAAASVVDLLLGLSSIRILRLLTSLPLQSRFVPLFSVVDRLVVALGDVPIFFIFLHWNLYLQLRVLVVGCGIILALSGESFTTRITFLAVCKVCYEQVGKGGQRGVSYQHA